MQTRIRQFVAEHNQRYGATVILTSHYMADVTALCKRVLVIHHGKLLYDGDLNQLSERIAPFKQVRLDLEKQVDTADLEKYGTVVQTEGTKVTLRLPREQTSQVVSRLLTDLPVVDLTVEDPAIEEVIDQVFQKVEA